MGIVLTKSNWIFFLNWIPELLGFLMNGVYGFISKIGIPNVGLAIILFTIVMYLLMTPLQVQQQRFTKLNAVMNPELQRIQAKYKGKNDQISQQKMADETNAVYAKYGVNPMGSCIQLLIQMPVLFALYQVIYRIPGYITYIGDVLRKVAEDSAFVKFFTDYITKLDNNALSAALGLNSEVTTERVMDTVYKLNTEQWNEVLKLGEGKEFEATLQSVHEYIHRATSFLGLNISDSPMNIFQSALKTGAYGLVVVAVMIPILAWVTQMMNIKLAQGVSGNNNKKSDDTMSQTMNSMNTFMPIMSAVFCFSLPVGIGIYWVIGALVRSIQQLLINRYLDNQGIDEIVRIWIIRESMKSFARTRRRRTRNVKREVFRLRRLQIQPTPPQEPSPPRRSVLRRTRRKESPRLRLPSRIPQHIIIKMRNPDPSLQRQIW